MKVNITIRTTEIKAEVKETPEEFKETLEKTLAGKGTFSIYNEKQRVIICPQALQNAIITIEE